MKVNISLDFSSSICQAGSSKLSPHYYQGYQWYSKKIVLYHWSRPEPVTVEDTTEDYTEGADVIENEAVRRRRRRQQDGYDADYDGKEVDRRVRRQLSPVMSKIKNGVSKVERNQYDVKKIANQIDPGKLLIQNILFSSQNEIYMKPS